MRLYCQLVKMSGMETALNDGMRDPSAEDPEHYRHVFDQVAHMLRLTDQELATRAYISRQSINSKRKGLTRVRRRDLPTLATALNLPLDVFFQATIADAIKYALDHKVFDTRSAQFRCTEWA